MRPAPSPPPHPTSQSTYSLDKCPSAQCPDHQSRGVDETNPAANTPTSTTRTRAQTTTAQTPASTVRAAPQRASERLPRSSAAFSQRPLWGVSRQCLQENEKRYPHMYVSYLWRATK